MNPEQRSLVSSLREHFQEARELGIQIRVGLTEHGQAPDPHSE